MAGFHGHFLENLVHLLLTVLFMMLKMNEYMDA